MTDACSRLTRQGCAQIIYASMLFATLLLAPFGSRAADPEPIRIGIVASLSGTLATIGTIETDAVQVIADKINREGGVKGRRLEITVFDDNTNPTEAARGGTKLIQQDKVVAILGATTGSTTLALAPITARYQVPLIATVATSSVINKSMAFYPWTFRSGVDEAITTRALLQRIAAQGVKRLAIYYQEDAYGKSSSDIVKQLAPEVGLEIVEIVTSSLSATDLTPQATKLRNANPEAVILLVSPPTLVAGFARAARQVGLQASLWGGIAFGQKVYVDLVGSDSEGLHAMLTANFDEPTPAQAKLAELLRAAGKKPNGFTEITATNALLHLVKALEADPAATGEKLRLALESVCNLSTYSNGTACYTPDNHSGWTADALTLGVVRNGRFTNVK